MKVFGRRWFETGGISMYFRYATTHLEPVQAFMKKPDAAENVQADIWMNDVRETSSVMEQLRLDNPPSRRLCVKD